MRVEGGARTRRGCINVRTLFSRLRVCTRARADGVDAAVATGGRTKRRRSRAGHLYGDGGAGEDAGRSVRARSSLVLAVAFGRRPRDEASFGRRVRAGLEPPAKTRVAAGAGGGGRGTRVAVTHESRASRPLTRGRGRRCLRSTVRLRTHGQTPRSHKQQTCVPAHNFPPICAALQQLGEGITGSSTRQSPDGNGKPN